MSKISPVIDLKSFFTFLKKNKTYTFIDVFGFSVSIGFVILIAVYSLQELSVDKQHNGSERIYAVASTENFGMAYRLGDWLKDRFPEIEKTCAINSSYKATPFLFEGQQMTADLLFTDPAFFELFSFELIRGDRQTVLSAPEYAVISESFARRLFAGKDPVGESLVVNDNISVTISGVMKDIKNSSINACDIVLRMDQIPFKSILDPSMAQVGSTILFVQEKKQANLPGRIEDIEAYMKEIFWVYQVGHYSDVLLIPLKEIYFSEIPVHSSDFLKKGNRSFVIILLSVGILILIFSIINYINLTVAQSGYRAKEMAIRRLLGSERKELIFRLITESVLLTSISFLIAILLSYIWLSYANWLLETKLHLNILLQPLYILIGFGALILIGLTAGLLPAVVISQAKPVDVVKGQFRQQTKMVFSKFFITFQNMITVSLVAASFIMFLQVNYLLKAPLGYKTRNLMDISVMNINDQLISTLTSELTQLASVKRVAYSQGLPLGYYNVEIFEYESGNIGFSCLTVDSMFMDMYGIKVLHDNQLATDEVYFSEQALIDLGIDRQVSSVTLSNTQNPIAGVINNMWLQNRNEPLNGVRMRLLNREKFQGNEKPWYLTAEIQGDHQTAYEQIRSCYETITGMPFNGQFMDTRLKDSMINQIKTSRLVSLFACVAIVISLMGLFAMSTYFIQQRAREVAVRKVFGSNNKQILYQLVATFLSYVLLAFFLITPVIWYSMNNWLSGYNYRITLNPFIFLTAGLCCLFFSFITVFIQSYQAANQNPVINLKAE